ncbi:LapA family protein [Candidatus Contubernalis alkaliaceticus]|uniref:LapA family protein n=1 Tax=Candidatus Contubernalis alkaliaceticus TaxID=338645 RepID=UPI001F4C317B|nr:LapA family protein [Candidatus Contubernalis alkalaceticus]UNC92893.1 LapA family protein [Candidatus Contubernalis alkalaceticus]
MQLGVIVALLFSILIALFAILNNEVVEINYLLGRAPVSVVIVILASAFTGALIVGLFSLVGRVKSGFRSREHQSHLKKLEDDLNQMAQRESDLLEQVSRLEQELSGVEEQEPMKKYTQDLTLE